MDIRHLPDENQKIARFSYEKSAFPPDFFVILLKRLQVGLRALIVIGTVLIVVLTALKVIGAMLMDIATVLFVIGCF